MTLHELLVDEIKDLYHAEKQLTKALPKLAKAASHDDLREAFASHLEETKEHIARLEQVFEALDEKVKAKPCAGMAGIIEEGADMIKEDADGAVMDAGLIASAQRAEHYEITAYGTCIAWARLLELDEVVSLLEQTLDEEKACDAKLSALAEGEINQAAQAQEEGDEDDEEAEEVDDRKASRVTGAGVARSGSTGGRAAQPVAADRGRARGTTPQPAPAGRKR